MRILVTGASGLLGHRIYNQFREGGHEVTGTYRSREVSGLVRADLTKDGDIRKLFEGREYDVIIHPAAIREPEECEADREFAWKVNVEATEKLIEFSTGDPLFVYISTDYVFPGEAAPYGEDDEKRPLNYYGETKSASEDVVRKKASKYIIARVPHLYGDPGGENSLMTDSIDVIKSKREVKLDDYIVRYPTYIGDVAKALELLVGKGSVGIVHLSSEERGSKYEFARLAAELMGEEGGNIKPDREPPGRMATRPYDSHLSTDKFKSLGGFKFRGYREVLPELLK